MTARTILSSLSLVFLLCGASLRAADEPRIGEIEIEAKEAKKPEVSIDDVKIRRTTVFDEAEIKKLYKKHKARNDEMNDALPAHLNGEDMELVTLKTLNVGANNMRTQRALVERLDPRPRQRLARIAAIDPDAAHEMMVTMRNDEAFMSGANDRRRIAGDPGRSVNFNASQLAGVLDKALSALSGSSSKKKKEEEESK